MIELIAVLLNKEITHVVKSIFLDSYLETLLKLLLDVHVTILSVRGIKHVVTDQS